MKKGETEAKEREEERNAVKFVQKKGKSGLEIGFQTTKADSR